jgi:hypothetical protein
MCSRVLGAHDPLFRIENGQEFLCQEQGLIQAQQIPKPGDRWRLHVGTSQNLFSTEDRPGTIVQKHSSLMERHYPPWLPLAWQPD